MKKKKEKTIKVQITLFEKPADLKKECGCFQKATIIVVASSKGNHSHIYCCDNMTCTCDASNDAARKLFEGLESSDLGPEKLKKSCEEIENFELELKEQ